MSKKAQLTAFFGILSWVLVALSTYVFTNVLTNWYGLLAGFVLMLVALSFHIIGRKKNSKFYVLCTCINQVATGLSLSAYYTYNNHTLSLTTLCITFLCYLFLCLLLCYCIDRVHSKKRAGLLCGFVFGLLYALSVYGWVNVGSTYSFYFFTLTILLLYVLLALKTFHTSRNYLADLSFASFGIYLLITYIVIVLLSEGDGLDLIDLSDSRKKQKP
ncbi:hypothetical protein [Anaerosporobacter faecicola]|uniref:hypothetical protein n=1 Tax=Anaerosporobacter faecicola TaxID=2718714 RepID=UPI00143A5EC6|nr:hypothetical protein [Anaerosporobacter faecicola]